MYVSQEKMIIAIPIQLHLLRDHISCCQISRKIFGNGKVSKFLISLFRKSFRKSMRSGKIFLVNYGKVIDYYYNGNCCMLAQVFESFNKIFIHLRPWARIFIHFSHWAKISQKIIESFLPHVIFMTNELEKIFDAILTR